MKDTTVGRRDFLTATGVVTAGALMSISANAQDTDKKEEEKVEIPAPVAVTGGWEIQKAINPNHLTEGEAKHVPEILVETNRVRIRCKHPMLADHFIQRISLYCGDRELGVARFLPEITEPDVVFVITHEGEYIFRAISECNKHGLYETKSKVEIKMI